MWVKYFKASATFVPISIHRGAKEDFKDGTEGETLPSVQVTNESSQTLYTIERLRYRSKIIIANELVKDYSFINKIMYISDDIDKFYEYLVKYRKLYTKELFVLKYTYDDQTSSYLRENAEQIFRHQYDIRDLDIFAEVVKSIKDNINLSKMDERCKKFDVPPSVELVFQTLKKLRESEDVEQQALAKTFAKLLSQDDEHAQC